MDESLAGARLFANKLRFVRDIAGDQLGFFREQSILNGLDEGLYHSSIEISSALTPTLWQRLTQVCERLKLPISTVSAFIHFSQDLQASCLAAGSDGCIIRFSSALVNLLDEDEFEFVAGHELGHFLLGHSYYHYGERESLSPEYFMLRRSQEISVDRIGLHACNSLDVALRAMMKAVSGLTGRHLRFDVSAFIAQLTKISQVTGGQAATTHPSMFLRSKALLWYSVSDLFCKGDRFFSSEQIRKIDERIERDLNRFVDGVVKSRIEATKQDLFLWMLAFESARLGGFSKEMQMEMARIFGEDTIGRLRSFLDGCGSKADTEEIVHAKVRSAREELERLIPGTFLAEIDNLTAEVRGFFTRAALP